jgi:MYXO-CTERM domain-containing protein
MAANAAAETYYVAPKPTGDDTHTGAANAPWATLQHAANTIVAGDTVQVATGHYAGFHLVKSGTEQKPIQFVGDGAFIDDPVVSGIHLENASWTTVDLFEVTKGGILVEGGSHSVVQRTHVSGIASGAGIRISASDDVALIGNETDNCQTGIVVGMGSLRPVIRANRVHDNATFGIFVGGGTGIQGATIEQNIVYATRSVASYAGVAGDGLQNSRIWNNLIYDNKDYGILLYKNGASVGANSNQVMNNTIIGATDGRWALAVLYQSTDNIARNNILLNRGTFGSIAIHADCLPFSSDYNVVTNAFVDAGAMQTLAEWQTASSRDLHSLQASEAQLFVDADAGNYALLKTAPAVDKGNVSGAPTFDLLGYARPQGAGFDIGAYELNPNSGGPDGNAGAAGMGSDSSDGGRSGDANAGGAAGSSSDSSNGGSPVGNASAGAPNHGLAGSKPSGGSTTDTSGGTDEGDDLGPDGGATSTTTPNDAAADDGGCGCHMTPNSGSASSALLLLALATGLRRRSRRNG